MNYIFCDKKCYEELKEIDTLLDTKCSDIDKAIAKLKEKKNDSVVSDFVEPSVFVLTAVTVLAILYFFRNENLLWKCLIAGCSALIFVHIWSFICVLIDVVIDAIRNHGKGKTKLKEIDQALENLHEFKEKFKQIRDKLRLSELFEIEQLCRCIRECKNTYAQVFLNIAERDSKTVLVTVTAKAETKRSKDGTAEFHTLGRKKEFTIAKDFCTKIFPDPDTCDFSWLDNTSKQCFCSVECISEKIDDFTDTDHVKMLEMKLDDQDLCKI